MTQSREKKAPRLKAETIPPDEWTLLSMLQYKRPSSGKTEAAFIKRYVLPLGATPDGYGNHWLRIGQSDILWSCHTDTVHDTEGGQRILYGQGIASVENGECLGADCGTGVWLMCEMAKAKVPGLYIFHTDEEIGGYGSAYIASELTKHLAGVRFAVAFDRKGEDEIITHQMNRRCASDAFARSLAQCLDLPYKPSDGGTFTDTANYAKLIPECTNISVGYYQQHTKGEIQNVRHALKLRDALVMADFSTLICERDHTAPEPVRTWPRDGNRWRYDADDDLWGERAYDPDGYREDPFVDFIRRNPIDVAEFLTAIGYGQEDIEDYIHYGDTHDAVVTDDDEKDC